MLVALVVCLAPALLVLHVGTDSMRSSVDAFVPHDSIIISGDASFHAMAALEGWSGSGVAGDPYIIAGYEIGVPITAEGFSVSDSGVHFVLRNCYIHDYMAGIMLSSAQNGTVENCMVESCEYFGLEIIDSNATIVGNSIRYSTYGGICAVSHGARFYNNEFDRCTIGLMIQDDGTELTGNTFSNAEYMGLYMMGLNITMRDNIFLKDGMYLVGDLLPFWTTHDIDTSNTVNGRPILYLVDDVGSTIGTNYGQVILANCTDTVVESQDLENASVGAEAGFCSGITIRTSVLRDNYVGAVLLNCDNSTITGNTLLNNTVGTGCDQSADCTISGNTYHRGMMGIRIYGSADCSASGNTIAQGSIAGIMIGESTACSASNNVVQACANGIYVSYAQGSTLSDNDINDAGFAAIYLTDSTDAVLAGNKMLACGVVIGGSSVEEWNTHTIDTSNTVNSLPVIYLKDLIGAPVPAGAGQVILANCSQMQASGSTMDRASIAFQLGFSAGCRVTGSSASNCAAGVYVSLSTGIQVDNMMLDGNMMGVLLTDSDMCTVSANQIADSLDAAILLVDSTGATLDSNDMTNGGIMIEGSVVGEWNSHTIGSSNTVNGKPVYYAKLSSSVTVPSGRGQVILASCTGFTIPAQTIVNASAAVQLGYCTGTAVNDLRGSENVYGIRIWKSGTTTITKPYLDYNQYGIYMEGGTYTTIMGGLFYGNRGYAIYMDYQSYWNVVTGNSFQYNNGAGDTYDPDHVQAYDENGYYWAYPNRWNGTDSGNYWQDWLTPDADSDGIVDVPYQLDGDASLDYYPLTDSGTIIPELGLAQMLCVVAGMVAVVALASRRVRSNA